MISADYKIRHKNYVFSHSLNLSLVIDREYPDGLLPQTLLFMNITAHYSSHTPPHLLFIAQQPEVKCMWSDPEKYGKLTIRIYWKR